MKFLPIIVITALLITIFEFVTPDSYPIRNEMPRGETIVCFGDSLTQGVGASKNLDYPAQLSKLLQQPIHNLGVSGNTTSQALARINDVLDLNPKFVLITLGGNDLKNGVNKKIAFQNLKKIIETIQNQGALVILGGIKVPFLDKGFSEAYKKVAKDTGVILIPNVLDGLFGNVDLMSDSIHPNDKGYTIMAGYFYDALKPYL